MHLVKISFQFQCGAIRSSRLKGSGDIENGFNSSVVRLEEL